MSLHKLWPHAVPHNWRKTIWPGFGVLRNSTCLHGLYATAVGRSTTT